VTISNESPGKSAVNNTSDTTVNNLMMEAWVPPASLQLVQRLFPFPTATRMRPRMREDAARAEENAVQPVSWRFPIHNLATKCVWSLVQLCSRCECCTKYSKFAEHVKGCKGATANAMGTSNNASEHTNGTSNRGNGSSVYQLRCGGSKLLGCSYRQPTTLHAALLFHSSLMSCNTIAVITQHPDPVGRVLQPEMVGVDVQYQPSTKKGKVVGTNFQADFS
jgi:hypothetical protein